MFWSQLDNIYDDVITFCLVVYSYSNKQFLSLQLPVVSNLVENEISQVMEAFLQKLVREKDLSRVIKNFKLLLDAYPGGSLYFMDTLLKIISQQECDPYLDLDQFASIVFDNLKSCFTELYWNSSSENIFDKLIVHLVGAVLSNPQVYSNIEQIFLENILCNKTWSVLLAIDSWSLLLSFCPNQFTLRTLLDLMNLENNLDFGINTCRPEKIHLKWLIREIYEILPNVARIEVVKHTPPTTNLSLYKIIDIPSIPESDILVLSENAINSIAKMGSKDFTIIHLKQLAETFEVMSTLNKSYHFHAIALLDVVSSLWEVNHIPLYNNNNIFRFFITKLCKLTSALIKEFSHKQLLIVMNRIEQLSLIDSYRLFVCQLLESLSYKNFNDFGQNGYGIFKSTSVILSNLMHTDNNIIKQTILEVIVSFRESGKENIIGSLMKSSDDVQREIIDYLNKDETPISNCNDYYVTLNNNTFVHKCVHWQRVISKRENKRLKSSEDSSTNYSNRTKCSSTQKNILLYTTQFPRSTSLPESSQNECDTVGEVITTLKGDVKCLIKLLNTDKLSVKNISDIRMITNQLLSLM